MQNSEPQTQQPIQQSQPSKPNSLHDMDIEPSQSTKSIKYPSFVIIPESLASESNILQKTLQIHNNIKNDTLKYKRFLYELCWQVLNGQLQISQLIEIFKEIKESSLLADLFWALDVETENNEDAKKNLISLVKQVTTSNLVDSNALIESVGFDTLEKADVIRSAKVLRQKSLKLSTAKMFTQQKYNLFREESEGYSKLIIELLFGEITEKNWENILMKIKSLIGYFNLDPNRVFDVVLDAFEQNPENENFLKIINAKSMFKVKDIAHIIGFKYRYYSRNDVFVPTPQSLHNLSAILIKKGLMKVDDLIPHLIPSNERMKKQYEIFVTRKQAWAAKQGVVSLSSTGEEEKTSEQIEKEMNEVAPIHMNNQKLGLIAGLLDAGVIDDALRLLDHLSFVNPYLAPVVSDALRNAISKAIEPIYSKISPRNACEDKKIDSKFSDEDIKNLETIILPLIKHLHFELHRDVILFTKVLRVLAKYFEKISADQIKGDLLHALEALFSALCLGEINVGLNYEFWEMLRIIPYEIRYQLYGTVDQYGYNSQYKMIAQRNIISHETKKILRRVARENTKLRGRALAKLGHTNPIIVCKRIIDMAENYDNQIPVLVESLRYVTPLFHDVMQFCILERLTALKDRLKPDGTTIASWLTNIGTFSGLLFKKFPSTTLEPLITYIIVRIREGVWQDLVILGELVKQMASIEVIEEISATQLEAHAGGCTLRQEAGGFSPTTRQKNTTRSVTKLRDTLLSTGLGRELILLLSKLRGAAIFQFAEEELPSSHLKLVADCHDKCHEALLLLIRFIEDATTSCAVLLDNQNIKVEKKQNQILRIPEIQKLVNVYGIEHEVAFALVRPAVSNRAQYKAELGSVRPLHPESIWSMISEELYTLFWTLDLYDVHVPKAIYQEQISKIRKQLAQLTDSQTKEHKRQKRILENVVKRLNDEMQKDSENYERVLEHINKRKDYLLQNCVHGPDGIWVFIQYCLYPRIIFSPADALYCVKFIELLHQVSTPYFNTVLCIYHTITNIPYWLNSCTEAEAQRLGRFLLHTLQTMDRWASSKEVFEKECASKPGFATVLSKPNGEKISYEKFERGVYRKTHTEITEGFYTCLTKGETMIKRNALLVLTRVSEVYPKKFSQADKLEKIVSTLKSQDVEESLRVLAARYHSIISGMKNKLQKEERRSRSLSRSRSISPRTTEKRRMNAQPDSKRHTPPPPPKKLNPEAPPFVPKESSRSESKRESSREPLSAKEENLQREKQLREKLQKSQKPYPPSRDSIRSRDQSRSDHHHHREEPKRRTPTPKDEDRPPRDHDRRLQDRMERKRQRTPSPRYSSSQDKRRKLDPREMESSRRSPGRHSRSRESSRERSLKREHENRDLREPKRRRDNHVEKKESRDLPREEKPSTKEIRDEKPPPPPPPPEKEPPKIPEQDHKKGRVSEQRKEEPKDDREHEIEERRRKFNRGPPHIPKDSGVDQRDQREQRDHTEKRRTFRKLQRK